MSPWLKQIERRCAKAEVPGADPGGDTTWCCGGVRSPRDPVKVETTGSNPVSTANGLVAQPGAHRAGSAEDVGSRPTRSTIRQIVYPDRMGVHTPYVRGYRFESDPPDHYGR